MAEKQIQFRPGDVLAQLQERAGETFVSSPDLVAKRDLERYYALLELVLPKFSLNESLLLVDAMNGCMLDIPTIHLLWANIADALEDGLAEKWHVDGASLVARLRRLSRFECLAVYDAIERAWNDKAYRIKNMEERVKAVGMVRKDDVTH